MRIIMEPLSLYVCSQRCLLSSRLHLRYILDHLVIPTSIHVGLLVEALTACRVSGVPCISAISDLISYWPQDILCMMDLLPDGVMYSVLEHDRVTDMIIRGLLNIHPRSKLTTVDFCCVVPTKLFLLPVFYKMSSGTTCEELTEIIKKQCKDFVSQSDDIQSLLTWRFTEILKETEALKSNYNGPGVVEIYLENKVCLTERVFMIDQIIGLSTCHQSPFRFHFTKLSVDNFYIKESKFFVWLLSTVDLTSLRGLYLYGKKRSIRLAMLELGPVLANIPNLSAFALGSTGPRISQIISPDEPTNDECAAKTSDVLQSWNNLDHLSLIGVVVSGNLKSWLIPLKNNLSKINLYSCKITGEDLLSLSVSHHLPTLTQLSLERNDFSSCSQEMCEVLKSATSLEMLNLRETNLSLEDKLLVISALHELTHLHILVLYEQENMVPCEGYDAMINLACAIQNLKEFYVFPFNYEPFEALYRNQVEESTESILCVNNRTDIDLYYH